MGLLGASRKARRLYKALAPSHWARLRLHRRTFEKFKNTYCEALRSVGPALDTAGQKIALLLSTPGRSLETELWLIKALTLAGLVPVVLMGYERRHLRRYHQLAGARETYLWTDFGDDLFMADIADGMIGRLEAVESLLQYEYAGSRVGQFAVSTTMQRLRAGSLDLAHPETRKALARHLRAAMSSAVAARRIVTELRPALAIIADCDYTPLGQMFDVCLANGIDVIGYESAHKSDALFFKRYARGSRPEHPASLSDASWRAMREMPWDDVCKQRLQRELDIGYGNRDWYSVVGTQFRNHPCEAGELRDRLGLDPGKRTAFIFPHISWDAPFGWGTHLFRDYDDWLVETVRAACVNDRVNWVVKFHPANVGKSALWKYREEPAESVALRKRIGSLPSHVRVMPADSGISTDSLFPVMDCCLTVRGTIGLEAAVRGIPVMTGGTGRYDHRGFTIDSETAAEYLNRIAHIEELPPLSPVQQELAQRYAYGLFILRPLPLTSLALRYHQSENESGELAVRRESLIVARTTQDWNHAPDLKALTRWLNDSTQLDFLAPAS